MVGVVMFAHNLSIIDLIGSAIPGVMVFIYNLYLFFYERRQKEEQVSLYQQDHHVKIWRWNKLMDYPIEDDLEALMFIVFAFTLAWWVM